MQYLNLTDGFEPFGPTNSIFFERFQFPGGEQHIKLKNLNRSLPTTITGRFHLSNDVMLLFMAVDALKRSGISGIELFIPYLPYARQDRVMVPGEPLSIKVFADLINACGFKRVTVFDPHSDVSAALLNNCKVLTNSGFVKTAISRRPGSYICCPDAGAEKKIYALCQDIGYQREIIFGRKHREVATGRLTSADVINTTVPNDILIVDDICDGGGTFTMLAQTIKNINPATRINLVVSHGIFSKGFPIEGIDHVYTTDSFQTIQNTDYVTQIPLSI